MPTVEELTEQIKKCQIKMNKLFQKRRDICTHENIEHDSWCDDDYAATKTYSDSFKCKDCGLYGSSFDKNATYELLKSKYFEKKYKIK